MVPIMISGQENYFISCDRKARWRNRNLTGSGAEGRWAEVCFVLRVRDLWALFPHCLQ